MRLPLILLEIFAVLMIIGTVSGLIIGDGEITVMCLVSCGAVMFVHHLIKDIQ